MTFEKIFPGISPQYLSPTQYIKMPKNKEIYLAHVVAIKDPLNLHLDIYWSDEIQKKYIDSIINYEYTFISEELNKFQKYTRYAYSCHLKGVEICIDKTNIDTNNMKEAYIYITRKIYESNGWVLVSITDIDVYKRLLVNVFDVITRKSYNSCLLHQISSKTGEHITKQYVRPIKLKQMFQPNINIPKDYHIIYKT